jgi:DNA-directed RNA polymerase subunit RPC12/RpoP
VDYRVERCPRCHLRPVEEFELPRPFPRDERHPVSCRHCGVRLIAVRVRVPDSDLDEIVFLLDQSV